MPNNNLPRKELFDLPEGVIYLDGNSLGAKPKAVDQCVQEMIRNEWGGMLIRGWNDAMWAEQPARISNRIGRLIGAPEDSVTIGDTLSIKVYQALASALQMRPKRKVILSDNGNFPTDLYMAQGLVDTLDNNHELRVVDPEQVIANITDDVAVVMLTEVDYRSGRKHEMKKITELAHTAGAVMIWDLAHSAGAVPVDLAGSHCEFAVGCTYKYLNGGPGSPAFIYVRPDLIEEVKPALSGWLGHDTPFAFEPNYRPAANVERLRVGTPPVIQMASLEEALKVWDGVTLEEIREATTELCELFIQKVEACCPSLTLVSPRDANVRGSQISFSFEHGYAAMQALIARGVIGDFRAPNVMRFGFTPLYIDKEDVLAAVEVLQDVIDNRLWDKPEYLKVNKVT